MQTFISTILIFTVIIFVHELGHYLVAKSTGIRVEEFSLGMGPQIIGRKKGETLYSLRALPLGGYCKMTGENVVESEDKVIDSKRFDQKPIWVRASVLIAGSMMNFILGIIIFILIFTAIGIPYLTDNIGNVMPGSVAEEAGIQPGDKIISIDGEKVNNWEEVTAIIHQSSGKELYLGIERGKDTFEVTVIPQYDVKNKIGLIGITSQEPQWQKMGLTAGITKGFTETYNIVVAMFNFFGDLLGKLIIHDETKEIGGVMGPLGIIDLIRKSVNLGIFPLAYLTALITINLGFINLLPIPALDGGRLFFIFIEAIRGKKVKPEKENLVHLVGFALLMLLMIIITWQDIARFMGS
jgi:regulator of sigma E protease